MARKVLIVPKYYQLNKPLTLAELCGDAVSEWNSVDRPREKRLFSSFHCVDADQNPIQLECRQLWHNGGIELSICVAHWVINNSHLPLLLKTTNKDKETIVPYQLRFLRTEKVRVFEGMQVNGLEGMQVNGLEGLQVNGLEGLPRTRSTGEDDSLVEDVEILLLNDEEVIVLLKCDV